MACTGRNPHAEALADLEQPDGGEASDGGHDGVARDAELRGETTA
jgi:hypothetical protein